MFFNHAQRPKPKQADHPRHMHLEYEILLFMAGGPSYVVDGRKYPLSRGTLLLVPPNSYHFALVEDAAVYHRYLLNFRGDAFDRQLLEDAFPKEARCYTLEESHSIMQAFARLDGLNKKELGQHKNAMLHSFCTQILLEILMLDPDRSHDVKQYPVLAYIDKHLDTIRSAEDVADAFFVSVSTICHQFRDKMGISLMKYIRQKRLLMARHLLEKGERPMSVYGKCGFSDYTTFYKAYVRYFGAPPSGEMK